MRNVVVFVLMAGIFVLLFLGIFLIIKRASKRSKRLVQACSAQTMGTAVKIRLVDEGKRITVEYVVDGVKYKISENIGQYRSQTPVVSPDGKRRTYYRSYLTCRPGDPVAVMYDPRKPSRAYLRDNKGQAFYN